MTPLLLGKVGFFQKYEYMFSRQQYLATKEVKMRNINHFLLISLFIHIHK